MSSRIPPKFQFPESKPKPTPYSPPTTSISSNGLFSAQTTPVGDRYPDSPAGRSLFAGATPAAGKSLSSKFGANRATDGGDGGGGGGLFPQAGGKPPFSLSPSNGDSNQQPFPQNPFGKSPIRPGAALGRYSSPVGIDDSDDLGYTNRSSPMIYEDDSREASRTQEDEDDDTGEFGDEEDFEEDDDTMQDESETERIFGYNQEIGLPANEPGTLILRTDNLMSELSDVLLPRSYDRDDYYDEDDMEMDMEMEMDGRGLTLEAQQDQLSKASKAFLSALHEHLPKHKRNKADNNLHNAYYLASLALPLNHSTTSVTEVLRKWLFVHHANPTRAQLTAVRATHPSSSFAPDFWDVVSRLVLRGEVLEATEILRSANWDLRCEDAPAVSKPAFGAQRINDKRYTREEIDSVKDAVATLVTLLLGCPAKGRSSYLPPLNFFPQVDLIMDSPGNPSDWRIWRGEVLKALEELRGLSQGDESVDDDTEDSYYNSFHPVSGSFRFGNTKAAKVKVPTEFNRQIRKMYDVMHGERDSIVVEAESWQELVVALMMWAKDTSSAAADEEEEYEDSINVMQMAPGEYWSVVHNRRRRQHTQLTELLEVVTEEMPPNPTDSLELAAGGIMANDPGFVLEIEKNSQLVAATIVEIGGWAGWITRETTPKDPSRGRDMGLDEDDLALLEMGIDNEDIQAKAAEDTLRRYASSLFGTPWIDEDTEIEGWEIGSRLLNRVRNGRRLTEKLLASLPLPSTPRVEKLLKYTRDAHLDEAASTIAYKWAQHLQATSQSHGDILHFLSLAAPYNYDARTSLHETTTHLLEQSLLSSCPYPAEEDLDSRLKHLLSSPSDCESEILRFELSGYAALRTFYNLRKSSPGTAVKALAAVVRAAGEPIDGGTWDKDWESPVEPTVLPAVLRELLTCVDALGTVEALDVCKVLTDWESCGENLRKVSVEVGPEGSWIDLGNKVDVVKRSRESLCKVLARGWLKSKN